MITLTREEAQRLIDALLAWEEECSGYGWSTNDEECVALLRAKLSEPEQEPVAWMDEKEILWNSVSNPENYTALYTTPPQREWVGLTAKDLAEIPPECIEGAIWADAKLKEKNGF